MSTFDALLRDLRAHPEWREELRRELLDEQLLQVPSLVSELAAAQRRTEERVSELTADVRELAAAVHELATRMSELASGMTALATGMQGMAAELREVGLRTDRALGWVVEFRYRERPWAFFGPIARRLRLPGIDELDDLLDAAVADGQLAEPDVDDLRRADAVLRGRRDGEEVWLVLEASAKVDESDVRRAADRAELLRRTGRVVLALVAGEGITTEAVDLAARSGVWQVTDGSVQPPEVEAA